jgi:uncharacterized membrane protein
VTKRQKRIAWIWAGISLLAVAMTWLLVLYDAFKGYRQVFPVYAFAAAGLFAACACGYALTTLLQPTT